MHHRNRAVLALVATLGMILTTFAIQSPATAGQMNTSTFDTTQLDGSGPKSGTLPNGVEWSVDKGTGPNVQGYHVYPSDGVQTYTFSEPVSLNFSVAGINCTGEAIAFQEGILATDVNANHSWNPTTRTLTAAGASGADTSYFESDAPVTSFTITPIGAPSCGRGVASFEVGYFDNQGPTVSIAAPIDGGTFSQGQSVAADFSCTDGDTAHVDAITCVGDVADGALIDTSTTGVKSFTVTATDEHGASSSETVSYTVIDQVGVCSGTAIGLPLNINLGVANGASVPCVTDHGKVLDATVSLGALPFPLTALSPSVSVKVAEANSEKAGNTHKASATVANVKISFPLNNWSVELKDLWSEVSASTPGACGAGNDLSGQAEIGRIVRNGTHLYNQLNKPLSLALPLVGGIHLNQVTKSARTVSANAVFIDLPGGLLDINIGSSVAGVDC